MGYGEIKHFTDIQAWKLGREIRKRIYKIAKGLPNFEEFGLASQMRRCAVSVTSNIAEGYGRYHYQENIQFCRQSRGSLYEIHDHLITCLDENYINKETFNEVADIIKNTIKALDGYIRMLKNRKEEIEKRK